MTVSEAMAFFSTRNKHELTPEMNSNLSKAALHIQRGLKYLEETGLGYLRLGQPATTLSGGEAQRLKLATYMAKGKQEEILFIFDEPTTGLHFDDIRKLLDCFQKLINNGHSVIVIEHNLEILKCADHIIDLGPEGGKGGGYVLGSGTPEKISKLNKSYTGKYLKEYL
jgi:excinuclease ABC subunit A